MWLSLSLMSFSILTGPILVLHASDYEDGRWLDRIGNLSVTIPPSANFTSYYVHLTGNALSIALPTNPSVFTSVTYVIRFRVTSVPDNLGWVMSQVPDYGWSRALTISDNRMGGVGQTTGPQHFDSGLGTIPVGSWNVLVGTWTQGGTCQTWLNGVAGKRIDTLEKYR